MLPPDLMRSATSIYDGDKIEPESAWEHFNSQPNCKSEGVMGIMVGECSALDLPTRLDPKPFPEHAVIDFSAFSKNQIEKKANHR